MDKIKKLKELKESFNLASKKEVASIIFELIKVVKEAKAEFKRDADVWRSEINDESKVRTESQLGEHFNEYQNIRQKLENSLNGVKDELKNEIQKELKDISKEEKKLIEKFYKELNREISKLEKSIEDFPQYDPTQLENRLDETALKLEKKLESLSKSFTPEKIRDELQTLRDEDRLDISAVKGFEKTIEDLKSSKKEIRVGWGAHPLQVLDDGVVVDKATRFINFTGGTLTKTNGMVNVPTGGAPGGANTNVQFNNSGAFGGDSNFVWDNTNKYLGLGCTPTQRLCVQIDRTDTVDPGAYIRSLQVNTNVTGATVNTYGYVAMSAGVSNTSTATIAETYGLEFTNVSNGTGTTEFAVGVYGSVGTTVNNTIEEVNGYFVQVYAYTGHIDVARGVYIQAAEVLTGGTIDEYVGLYIGNQVSATNNWAIKTGSGLVQFGDFVGIGKTPIRPLHILDNTQGGIRLERTTATARIYDLYVSSTGSFNYYDATAGTNRFTITKDGYMGVNTGVDVLINTFAVNGNVSIGTYDATTAPSNSLIVSGQIGAGVSSVSGKIEATGSIYANATATDTVFSGSPGTNNANFIGSSGYWALRTNTAFAYNLDVYNGGTPFTAMTVLQGGNVGIGTTDLDGTPAAGKLVVKGSTNDGSTNVLVARDSDEANILTVDTNGNITPSGNIIATGVRLQGGTGSGWGSLAFGAGGAGQEKLTISGFNDGLILPDTLQFNQMAYKSDISNFNLLFTSTVGANSVPAARWRAYQGADAGNPVFRIEDMGTYSGHRTFGVGASNAGSSYVEFFTIRGTGNVGIDTTAPDKKLEINLGTSDALRLTYNDADGSATTYMDTTVSSVGLTTFTGAGSAPSFAFAQNVTAPYFIHTVGNALTATGTTRTDALQLSKAINNVTTAAAGTGVILPVGVIGMRIVIFNAGANAIQVYASASETIDGTAGSTGVPLTNAKRCEYFYLSTNNWVSAQLGVVSA